MASHVLWSCILVHNNGEPPYLMILSVTFAPTCFLLQRGGAWFSFGFKTKTFFVLPFSVLISNRLPDVTLHSSCHASHKDKRQPVFTQVMQVLHCDYFLCPGALALASACLSKGALVPTMVVMLLAHLCCHAKHPWWMKVSVLPMSDPL